MHSYIIKSQCIWNMHLPTDSSWTLRKIFGLRDMDLRFIKSVVGNGKNTFLWLDNWHTFGPLFLRFGNRVVFTLGRSLGAKVDSIIANGRWKWPRGRNASIIEIKAGTARDLVPAMDRDDKVVWIITPMDLIVLSQHGKPSDFPNLKWNDLLWSGMVNMCQGGLSSCG